MQLDQLLLLWMQRLAYGDELQHMNHFDDCETIQ